MMVCLVLFIFYYSVFSLLYRMYGEDEQNLPISGVLMTMAVVTGHMLVFFSHDANILPEETLCKYTEPVCENWVPEYFYSRGKTIPPNAVPVKMERDAGYCLHYTYKPSPSCMEIEEKTNFGIIAFILLAIYFAAGALLSNFRYQKSNS